MVTKVFVLCLLAVFGSYADSRRVRLIKPLRLPPPIDVRDERGQYLIVAPGKIIPNSVYYLSISTKDVEVDTTLNIAVVGNENEEIKVSDVVGPKQTKILKLQIGNLTLDKSYKLNVQASGAFSFNHSAKLLMEQKSVSIFIQTDKAMYKPSQTVLFRTVILNEDLKPIKTQSNVITTIKDANGNIIKKYKEKTPLNGILSQELKLSDQPVLGEWTITVEVNNKKIAKQFTVAEYVLPNFNVDIKLPPYVVCSSPEFVATATALYTYGKSVKGKMVFKIIDSFASYHDGTYMKRVRFMLQSEIDGEKDVEIKTEHFARECQHHSTKIDFEVSVEDKLTGKSYNKTKTLTIYDKKYKFQLLRTQTFKRGFDYVSFVKVSYPDGTPVENSNKRLRITYGFGYSKPRSSPKEFETVPVNGVAKIILDTKYTPYKVQQNRNDNEGIWYPYPRNDESVISMEATYDGVDFNLGSIQENKDECYTVFHILKEEFDKIYNVGEEITFEVTTDNTMHNFVYEVVTRKGVIQAHSFDDPITKTISFTLNVTRKYAPKANVVVHFFCGIYIIEKSVKIKVNGLFRNKPSLKVNATETQPGKMIKLKLGAKPGSSVAILAYDQRTALLKSGFDIEKSTVISEVNKQLGCKKSEHFSSCVSSYNHWRSWYPSGSRNSFKDSGLIHFTNTGPKEPINHWPRKYLRKQNKAIGAITGMAMSASTMANNHFVDSDSMETSIMEKGVNRYSKKADDVVIRQHFPETWIFEVIDTNEMGKSSIVRKIPDSITSWYITSFAINKQDGFGIADNPEIIKVFRPFFIKLSLPYSVIRGETIAIPVTVYNYMNSAQVTEVTMENKGDFEFVVAEKEMNEVSFSNQSKTQSVTITANDGVSLSFLIKPKKVGYSEIKIVALSDSASDAISEKLFVKPEGETHFQNKAILVNLRNGEKLNETVDIDIPKSVIPDSERVTVTAIGDILGPAINNLDDLLRMPSGCGEQNMINFVPNIVVLDYLTKSGKLTEKIKSKAISHIESGYQRELTYQHSDGSFSAFGKSDSHGSTWLTAYVLKSFIQAKNYINIDEKVIRESVDYLLSTQNDDGSFRENGRVLHTEMQSKSGENSSALTAYVFIALNTNVKQGSNLKEKLRKTEQYLLKNLQTTSDIYEIMIISYALQLHNTSSDTSILKRIKGVSKTEKMVTFWSNDDNCNSATIEMTSYGLMTIMLQKDIVSGLPVLRYLISKQNSNGGFSSTQDTVIALQALASFASNVMNSDPSIKVKVAADKSESSNELTVNSENLIVLQEVVLSPKTRKVKLEATGQGSTILQVSWKYNVANVTEKPSFAIRYSIDSSVSENMLSITVFTKFLKTGASGMTVMEVVLLSGFVADVEAFHDLKISGVKRVETKSENTVIVVYFDEITSDETSVKLVAFRKTKLADLKPVPITVYDYYDKSKTATIFYSGRKSSVCDICEGDSCGKSCVSEN